MKRHGLKPRLSLSQSFGYAVAGLAFVVRTQRNARIHLAAGLAAVILGVWVGLSALQWAVLAVVIGTVVAAEAVNTAIELLVDIVSPEYHETARAAKDAAAGAVLCVAMSSAVVGLIFFGPAVVDSVLSWLS